MSYPNLTKFLKNNLFTPETSKYIPDVFFEEKAKELFEKIANDGVFEYEMLSCIQSCIRFELVYTSNLLDDISHRFNAELSIAFKEDGGKLDESEENDKSDEKYSDEDKVKLEEDEEFIKLSQENRDRRVNEYVSQFHEKLFVEHTSKSHQLI